MLPTPCNPLCRLHEHCAVPLVLELGHIPGVNRNGAAVHMQLTDLLRQRGHG